MIVNVFGAARVSPAVEEAFGAAWLRSRAEEFKNPVPPRPKRLPPTVALATDERRAQVYEMAAEGMTPSQIAKALGVKPTMVHSDLARREQAKRGKKRAESRDEALRICREMFEAGASLREMAAATGRTYDTVRNYCAEMRLSIKGREVAERRARVKELAEAGKDRHAIARHLQIAPSMARHDLIALGLAS